MPHVEALHREKGQQGLKVFAVNVAEAPDAVKAFVQEQGWQLPILFDSDSAIAQAYGADKIAPSGDVLLPYQVLIDKQGKIHKIGLGMSQPGGEMDKAIDELLAK